MGGDPVKFNWRITSKNFGTQRQTLNWPSYDPHSCINRIYTTVASTDVYNNIKIILHKLWLPTCFGKPCAHLRGGKTQKMNTLKSIKWNYRSYQNHFTSQPRMRVILKSHFAGCLSWLQFSVVYCVIYINTHSLDTYLFWLPSYFPILLACNYLISINIIKYLTHTYFYCYRNLNYHVQSLCILSPSIRTFCY
jgi:hypothetical protein